MKRLIDERLDPGAPDYRLAELVRAMPTLERAPFAAERVRARVASAAARKRAPWAAGAIALGLGVSAVAAASVGRWTSLVQVSVPPSGVPLAAEPTPEPAGPPAPDVPELSGEPIQPLRVIATPAPPAETSVAKPAPRSRPVANRAVASGEDPAPLLEAIHALRSEGDPVRAGALLADYVKAYPRSPLSEDAIALSIEAATARHDARAAAEWARRYLTRFPSGKYRALAFHAEGRSPGSDPRP